MDPQIVSAATGTDIWSVISSVSTAAGVLVALVLATLPTFFARLRTRATSRRRVHILLVECMILLRNYYNYCPDKYKQRGRIKYWTDTDVETLVDIRNALDELDGLSSDLGAKEGRVLGEFTSNMRNLFSGWAVKEEKWVSTYRQGRVALEEIAGRKLWDIEFQEAIVYSPETRDGLHQEQAEETKVAKPSVLLRLLAPIFGLVWIAGIVGMLVFPKYEPIYWILTALFATTTWLVFSSLATELGRKNQKNYALYQASFFIFSLILPYLNIFVGSSMDATPQVYIASIITSVAILSIAYLRAKDLAGSVKRLKFWNVLIASVSSVVLLFSHYIPEGLKVRLWVALLPIAVLLIVQKLSLELIEYRTRET